jgi:hypothetical protein
VNVLGQSSCPFILDCSSYTTFHSFAQYLEVVSQFLLS